MSTAPKIALLVCSLLLSICSYSQDNPNQIILNLIEEADTHSDPDLMVTTLKNGLQTVNETSDSVKALFYYNLGVSYGMRYDVDSAKINLDKSVMHASQSESVFTQIGALNGLANVARIENDNDAAKEYYEQGLEIAMLSEEKLAFKWRAALLGNIAGIFFDLGNVETAVDYSKDAFAASSKSSDSSSMARNLVQLGYCYNALNLPDSALIVNERATEILEKINDKYLLLFQYYTMGSTFLDSENYDKAKYYLEQGILLAREYNEFETLIESLNALADLNIRQNQYETAESLLKESLDISGNEEIIAARRDAFKLYYELELRQSDFRNAISNLENYHLLKDSLSKQETINNIQEFRIKYETAEKEKEILEANAALAKKERFQLFLIVIITVVIFFSAIAIALIIQKSQLRNALLSQEIDTLRVQINSIFKSDSDEVVINPEKINTGLHKPLSEREIEIFQQALSDKTNRQIAEAMFVSINTVKYHLKNIYEKLGVSNRNEALNKILTNT